jgi:hypothetical protein
LQPVFEIAAGIVDERADFTVISVYAVCASAGWLIAEKSQAS